MKLIIYFILMTFEIISISVECNHRLRKFKLAYNQSKCNSWKNTISLNDKQVILNAHNWYRNHIAIGINTLGPKLPYAKNMLQMYWSEAIARKAQIWANDCKFMHSSKEFRKMADFPLGENLYKSSSSADYQSMNWNKAITAWYNEINEFAGKSVDSLAPSEGPVTGHFTQVIWANTYLVGCGFAQFMDKGWFTNFYVCQYGPVGNILNTSVYSSSPTKVCVCPKDTSCSNTTFQGLCCPAGNCAWQSQTYSGPLIPGTVPEGLI
jgi:hypothetical protein